MKPRSIFRRLVGLETEYAIRHRPLAARRGPPPSRYQLYLAMITALRQRVLAVDAHHFKQGVFTANGGAVWFERVQYAGGHGLIEGATPECRSPREVLIYQRAQDHLLRESTIGSHVLGEFALLKNDRDSRDNVYGAQENYEASVAEGWRLAAWRTGLVLLAPLMLVSWLGLLLQIVSLIVYLAFAGVLYLFLRAFLDGDRRRRALLLLLGEMAVEGDETASPLPLWLELVFLQITRLVTGPLAIGLWLLVRATAFVPYRRVLTPFLASRAVIGGAGMIDTEGRFHLADKAEAVNCLTGFGGFLDDRPLFSFGHFFKAMAFQAWASVSDYLSLFKRKQRLQICLGDSNMCEEAEYLRVGVTMLILDVIESGAFPPAPQLRRAIGAIRQISRDPSLTARVQLSGGREWTALQFQRYYLNGVRQFLDGRPDAPEEAHDIFRRWEEILDTLEDAIAGCSLTDGDFASPREIASEDDPLAVSRRDEETMDLDDPLAMLVGRLDWVTKRFLLAEAGRGAPWEARKKIDLRYHELSASGYFAQLAEAGQAVRIVTEEELERAVRNPPSGTPASARGRYIREFAEGSLPLRVNWNSIIIGRGLKAKIVDLARFGGDEE
jgi:Pup amidohydrolase